MTWRIRNVLVFLSSGASIQIPLLLFEASSLGRKFTAVRLCVNIVMVFAIAFFVDKALTPKEKEEVYANAEKLP